MVGHGVQGEEVMVWPLSRHSMGMLACASFDWDENDHGAHPSEAKAIHSRVYNLHGLSLLSDATVREGVEWSDLQLREY